MRERREPPPRARQGPGAGAISDCRGIEPRIASRRQSTRAAGPDAEEPGLALALHFDGRDHPDPVAAAEPAEGAAGVQQQVGGSPGEAQPHQTDSLGGGDLDFDGYEDLVSASAAEDVDGVERAGCAYVFMGDPSLPAGSASVGFASDIAFCGTQAHGRLGRHGVPQIVDVDGDLAPDIILGAPGDGYGGTADEGEVFIFFNDGGFEGTISTDDADVTIGTGDEDHFGYALHSGDIDGDGGIELMIGAPDSMDYDDDMDGPGAVYVFHLATLMFGGDFDAGDADLHIRGDGETQFGSTITSADFTGDGSEELIVAAPRYNEEDGRISVFSF